MTVHKLKPKPKPKAAAYPGMTQLRLIESHWQDVTADLQLLRYNYELIAGQFTRLQQHVGKLAEHCERLMREKEALLRAQRAEDETPHRLEMLEDDVSAIQRQIGKLNTDPVRTASKAISSMAESGLMVFHDSACTALLIRGAPCTCGGTIVRQAGG